MASSPELPADPGVAEFDSLQEDPARWIGVLTALGARYSGAPAVPAGEGTVLDHVWPTLEEHERCAVLCEIGSLSGEAHALPLGPMRALPWAPTAHRTACAPADATGALPPESRARRP